MLSFQDKNIDGIKTSILHYDLDFFFENKKEIPLVIRHYEQKNVFR